jgi:RNA recognition motif-containing protein
MEVLLQSARRSTKAQVRSNTTIALIMALMYLGIPRSTNISSIPRGPPRKPKQSGHALWVGNLPPGTTVVSMKDHFSRDATKEIESLFLISKSNCAFVNYRTETACTAAMHRFHDSRFNGVRLVCRLRRSSAPASGVPTGPSAMATTQQVSASPPVSPRHDREPETGLQDGIPESPTHQTSEETATKSTAANKYFIVKSLTLQDLELSVRNGIWATQSHNEDVLNKAYQVRLASDRNTRETYTDTQCSPRRMYT